MKGGVQKLQQFYVGGFIFTDMPSGHKLNQLENRVNGKIPDLQGVILFIYVAMIFLYLAVVKTLPC